MTGQGQGQRDAIVPGYETLLADDYQISVSAHPADAGGYYGVLQLVRKTDGRQLYPFKGASPVGPFASEQDAKVEAERLGTRLAEADMLDPET
jgi:hypothetical protein